MNLEKEFVEMLTITSSRAFLNMMGLKSLASIASVNNRFVAPEILSSKGLSAVKNFENMSRQR